ncbi:hypothetical protein [Comamonas sp. JUb58]|uniref:hypothetical protein n=1 Tax=Comamonas sp. JUb58 TaxID=2485114 RepID=UPI001414E72C|nr:hypothetical protein [Comamonas sp. JUb58]
MEDWFLAAHAPGLRAAAPCGGGLHQRRVDGRSKTAKAGLCKACKDSEKVRLQARQVLAMDRFQAPDAAIKKRFIAEFRG